MTKDQCILNFMTLQSWFMTYHPDFLINSSVHIEANLCEIRVHFNPDDINVGFLRESIDRLRLAGTICEVRDIECSTNMVLSIEWEWI